MVKSSPTWIIVMQWIQFLDFLGSHPECSAPLLYQQVCVGVVNLGCTTWCITAVPLDLLPGPWPGWFGAWLFLTLAMAEGGVDIFLGSAVSALPCYAYVKGWMFAWMYQPTRFLHITDGFGGPIYRPLLPKWEGTTLASLIHCSWPLMFIDLPP
jgi:hypothetical protein